MAGKKGMHSRRLNPMHAERIREKIQGGVIAERLMKHVIGEIEMTKTQVAAGLGLLRKVVPDLAAVEHSGEVNTISLIDVLTSFAEASRGELADTAFATRIDLKPAPALPVASQDCGAASRETHANSRDTLLA